MLTQDETPASDTPSVNLDDPSLYINRETSWLQFNWRVLEEALCPAQPLLERVKFLAICASNLDEFFMIRVSGLRRQVIEGVLTAPPDGMTPAGQLAAVHEEVERQLARHTACWQQDLLPKLREAGIEIKTYDALQPKQQDFLHDYFAQEIFPTLTPLAFDPAHPFPHISNLSLNLAVVVHDPDFGERFARVKVPDVFPRLIPVPREEDPDALSATSEVPYPGYHLVWIEDVLAAHLEMLFPGLDIVASYPFRVTRDADLEIQEDEASDLVTMRAGESSDLLTTMEEQIGQRHFGLAIRLELVHDTPPHIRTILTRNLELTPSEVYAVDAPLGMANLMELMRLDRPDLKDAPFLPRIPAALAQNVSLFEAIRRQNILLYHPYDSFLPVVDFVREAANDPDVLAIKQTLYRVGANSPIVQALMEARRNQKQVSVLVELKARFDEENNIVWARALEAEGVHVVYGVMRLKTHAKMCLVVRREPDGMRRYVHLGTGNYNAVTSRLYTDLGYFTCDPDIGADVAELFNALTGYSRQQSYRKLLVAPGTMRQEVLRRIEREIARHREHGDGYIALKMNALVDSKCIQALYRASQAGVRIELQVRGICCLRPQIPGVSETITVTSVVGRFLEHSRIYYFHNGGEEDVLVGSADLMPRNLDRRVEVLFPVEEASMRRLLVQDILQTHLRDNVQSRRLFPDGHYERCDPPPGEPELSSQRWMLEHWNT
ncbi:MAG TPA: polyphosphate kinase 1 [Candidatus Entotheonella sp.]